jgi:hypothetical protein
MAGFDEDQQIAEAADLVGRRIVAAALAAVPDGYAVLAFDDGGTLEIRTSAIGQLLLSTTH